MPAEAKVPALFKVNGKRCVFSAQLDLVSTQHELQLFKQTVSPVLRVSDVCVCV